MLISGVFFNICVVCCVRFDLFLVFFFFVNIVMGMVMVIIRMIMIIVLIIIIFLFILMMVNLKRNIEGCIEVGYKIMIRLVCINVVS